MPPLDVESLNQTISPDDALYPVYARTHGGGAYFTSALTQLDELDGLVRLVAGRELAEHCAIVDYACHFGRLARCLRAWVPEARVVAADLSRGRSTSARGPSAAGRCTSAGISRR